MWLHGGGFVAGGLEQEESREFGRALAAAGVRVVSVDYPLAPLLLRVAGSSRRRHPAQVDAVRSVLRDVRGRVAGPVLLGGASAGACVAAGAVAAAGRRDLAGLVLAYGFFHATPPRVAPEVRARLRGRRRLTHSRPAIALMNLNYAGTAVRRPSAFPGGHRLEDFPPTLLLDADRDAFRASSARFARELVAVGVPVRREVVPEAFHGFLGRPREEFFARGVATVAGWIDDLRPERSAPPAVS